MSHTVWRFQYTVEERIEALRDILVQQDKIYPSQAHREWLYRAQLILEPGGWFALWRLPKDSCHLHGVRFPCVVYVEVENIELSELNAKIKVIGVQDDSVHLPEKTFIPLIQLWPTLAQPNEAIDIKPTAEFIDLYRYFYTLIWMPWDLEEDEQENDRCWFEAHVTQRCSLWANSFAGEGCPTHMLYSLRDDGEIIRKHITSIEESLSVNDDTLDTNSKNVSTLVSLHEQLQTLRSRWELLQNPVLYELWNTTTNKILNYQSKITIIWTGGSMESYIDSLHRAKKYLLSKKILSDDVGCSPSLSSVLNSKLKSSSILLLCEGIHEMPHNCSLGDDHTLSSLSRNSQTFLKCSEMCTTAFNISGSISLNELLIHPGYSSTGFAVRCGVLNLHSCEIIAPSDAQTQAVIVFDGGEIIFNKCILRGFFTAIVAHKGSKIKLIDCILEDCGVMLQIYENAEVSLVKCKFNKYTENAIRYEHSKILKTTTGKENILQKYGNFDVKECSFIGNGSPIFLGCLDEYSFPQLEGNVII